MIELSAQEIVAAIGGKLHGGISPGDASHGEAAGHAHRAVIDSRAAGPCDLFFGLPGEQHDGGAFAAGALRAGAWGVVVAGAHFDAAAAASGEGQAVFGVQDPVTALGALANAWRHRLGAWVIGVTGSTGKTSTKDILAALLGKSRNVAATPANLNTEIGLPLTILSAEPGTEVLVLEMAMRGSGQIAELTAIAEPDVGCVVNVGPVHLEQLGSVEAVAAAKAELLNGLAPGAGAVVPADEPLLAAFVREDLRVLRFGEGGDVRLAAGAGAATEAGTALRIVTPDGETTIVPSFGEPHMVRNLLAAVACARLIGAPVAGELRVTFSALRGELLELLGGVNLINDCYNANPVSMRAALDNLGRASGRKLAVLGQMAELGPDAARFHHEVAEHAARSGVDLLVAVGGEGAAYGENYSGAIECVASPADAADLLRAVARPGDTVLVKGSRCAGLELVAERLLADGEAGEAGATNATNATSATNATAPADDGGAN